MLRYVRVCKPMSGLCSQNTVQSSLAIYGRPSLLIQANLFPTILLQYPVLIWSTLIAVRFEAAVNEERSNTMNYSLAATPAPCFVLCALFFGPLKILT